MKTPKTLECVLLDRHLYPQKTNHIVQHYLIVKSQSLVFLIYLELRVTYLYHA